MPGDNELAGRLWMLAATAAVIVLQGGLLPAVRLFGAGPDLALVFAVLLGFLGGGSLGMAAALVVGLFLDLAVGRFIGLHMLLKGLAVLAGSLVGRQVYRENAAAAFALVAGVTLLQEMFVFLLLRLNGIPLPLFRGLYYITLPELLYNLLLTPLVYLALYAITAKLPREMMGSEI